MPKISVVMPVYNAAIYLREAVNSILTQTFTDFELLLINDGSTDESAKIADSYQDPRIKRVSNEKNLGIVASLNKGVALARGEYIAIMHADDVSLPERLEMQAQYLDSHPDVALVASKAAFITMSGLDKGFWKEDVLASSHQQIRDLLPKTNCIVHPSVMIRRSIALSYPYRKEQKATEDYDLWLRLIADGHKISKIDTTLLKYRVHHNSITARTDAEVGEYKEVIAKAVFLWQSAKNPKSLNHIHYQVMMHLIRDFCRITINYTKVKILEFARNIFISLGKPLGTTYHKLCKTQNQLLLFLTFPTTQIGGAERVHADLVDSNSHRTPWVVIANEWAVAPTKHDENIKYNCSHVSKLLRNPFTKNLTIGFFVGYINRSKSVAFGGNCVFFYSLIPHLDPDIFCVDFIHGFGCEIEIISLPHVTRIDRRIVISEGLREDLVLLYSEHEIPDRYTRRICMVDYGVEVPENLRREEQKANLEVIYVGRGTEEKRVHLVGSIARLLAARSLPVRVSLIGDVKGVVALEDQDYCNFYGAIYDRNTLNDIYTKADIIVITSRTEGLSLVRMEAMAHAVVPIAVAVGAIPVHIENGVTGFLVSADQSEEAIVTSFCEIIEALLNDRQRLHQVSLQAYEFARCHFDRSASLRSFSRLFDVSVND